MLIKCQDSSDKTNDDQNNAYQEQHGECRVYHPLWPDASTGQEQPKCTRWCQGQGGFEEGDVAACVGFTLQTGDPHFDENFFYSFRDAEGRYYEMGECACDMALAGLVLDVVFEGIAEAMKLIGPILFIACKLFAGIIELVADASLSALPGGAAVTASRRAATAAVRAAKTTHQNGGSERSFQDLSTLMCPHANFGKLDFGKAFNKLLEVSDDYAKGDGCKAKKRSLEGRAKGSKGGDDGHERAQCRDLPGTSENQPPDNARDNGMEGREDRAKKEHEDRNKPKPTSDPPKATSTSSGVADPTNAGCAFCDPIMPKLARRDSETSGYGLMYARAPPDKDKGRDNDEDDCIRKDEYLLDDELMDELVDGLGDLRTSDDKCTATGLSARSLELPSLFGLEKRATSPKMATVVLPSRAIDRTLGRYPPCGSALKVPEIAKFFRFQHDRRFCSTKVEMVDETKASKNGQEYETEHVFEAQTLSRFIEWLAKGGAIEAGSDYTRPTEQWVSDVLMGDTASNNAFSLVSEDLLGTPSTGDDVFNVMTYGFGRSDKNHPLGKDRTLKLLTLAEVAINKPKGILFGGKSLVFANKISAKTRIAEDRMEVRRGAATFEYLKFEKQGQESIWKKWMKVSNWIDLVCHTFDEKYRWNSRPADEPKVPASVGGNPSLRALYAYWIDRELAGIEERMATWATGIKAKFDSKHKNPQGRQKTWRDNAFDTNGFATASKLKFPRLTPSPRTGASVYGAYGITDCTIGKDGKTEDIGVPTQLV